MFCLRGLQLGLVLLLAAVPPEDLAGTDIVELGERIVTLLELCQKKIAHSISSPAPDPPDKEDSIFAPALDPAASEEGISTSTCPGPSQDPAASVDDQDEGAVSVAVVEQALKAAPRRCRKSRKKSVTVTEVEKTEPRRKRGKGTKRDAEEPEKKDNATTEVAPKKRGRKPAATVADKEEEEEEDKEGEKKTEEKKAEEAPEVAVPEPEVPSSTR